MSPRHFNRLSLCAAAIGALAIAAVTISPSHASSEAVIIPPPAVDVQAADGIQTAVIAGGCFWGVQGVYQHTSGVLNAVSGYSGGSQMTANYTMIGTGTTGHAEAVEIKYDRRRSATARSAGFLLRRARPTQLNRQGGHRRNIARRSSPPMTTEEGGGGLYRPAQRRRVYKSRS
jgi:peptide-methionine (S)-S-oxide reductase